MQINWDIDSIDIGIGFMVDWIAVNSTPAVVVPIVNTSTEGYLLRPLQHALKPLNNY